MKTTSLKIGDIVLWTVTNTLVRVTQISENSICADDGTSSWHRKEEYEPVSLTPEILQKLGFEKMKGREDYFCLKCEGDEFPVPFFLEYVTTTSCLFINDGLVPRPVTYLHDLRMALLLCGIDKTITL